MPSSIHQILQSYWGFTSFRPQQQQIIESVLQGNDTLAVLPTGGGKSLCFQVPAMAKNGLCLVVSPLIALMKDQVEQLRKKGITAFSLHAGMSRKEVVQTLQLAGNSNCKFLYVSPERLESKLFIEYLPSLNINLLAVDEAHCISQWGYDFRPPYLRIAALRSELPNVPVLALTASATLAVQKDICDKLLFKQQHIFKRSFERPNLSYSVFETESRITKLVQILNNVKGSGIVYCKSRKRTKEVADQLNSYGIAASFYHAGLSTEERNHKQDAWLKSNTHIMVCTNAFGMGIDKPDVRIVVHYDIPDCLENYYQEAGRAGRNGNKAYAVALYQPKDIEDLKKNIALKFPTLEVLQQTYQQVANYLQLPAGLGEGNYYAFDINDFAQKFKADAFVTVNALKVLEQEEYLSFNEQVFVQPQVQFVCNKNTLYQFENDNPETEPVIKALLRSYEGIFDQATSISEKNIAYLTKTAIELVKQQLAKLQSNGIVEYRPQLDSPQLYFMKPRIKAEDIIINQQKFNERKALYEKRLSNFINYIEEINSCRSKMIGNYFGDDAMSDCGVCDNCLNKKKKELTSEEFKLIQKKIFEILQKETITTQQLLTKLIGIPKEKAFEVMEFLQSENKISVNASGEIVLVK